MAASAVCRVDELVEGVPKPMSVGERRIALVRWRSEIFAYRDICPHQNISFLHGRVRNPVSGDGPREAGIVEDRPVVACPRHHWQFDLHSGRCISDPFFRIRTYPVTVEHGIVYVNADQKN
jgi:nitrite reductase/ring-hydroxylating ferredoxin subunit